MRLLFDQNISFRIVDLIASEFPEAKQVRELQLEDCRDIEIWAYAKDNGFCIVTFDADFIDISNLKGSPPKIIWLRTGNTSTKSIAQKLKERKDVIVDFFEDDEVAFLEIL
jgi:predicted nuclease of predicted toxin-antitoxin system